MQHYVSELTSEITVTRQLATSGVNVLSMSLWQRKATLAAEEPRPYVPEVADAVKNALVESLNRVVSSDAKWVEQLVRRLANAHTNVSIFGYFFCVDDKREAIQLANKDPEE